VLSGLSVLRTARLAGVRPCRPLTHRKVKRIVNQQALHESVQRLRFF